MSERREDNRRDVEDDGERRKIKRFSDSRISELFGQIKLWTRIIMAIFLILGLYSFSKSFTGDGSEIGQNIFFAVIFLFISAVLLKYERSVNLYLSNGSINNLESVVAKQLTLWLVMGFSLLVTIIASLVMSS